MARLLIVLLFFLLPASALWAQNPVKTKTDKKYEKAVHLYEKLDYTGALRQLDELLEKQPSYMEALLLQADIYNDQKDFSNAVESYNKAVAIDSAFFPPAYYIMANLYFDMEKYNEAKDNYLKYIAFHPKIQAELKRISDNLVLCDFRLQMMKNPVPFAPENLGPNVNTTGYEYINAVSLDEKQLYFTRKGSDQYSDEGFYVSLSDLSPSGQLNWNPAAEIGEPLNTPGNEGALCVSPDGSTIIITCCSRRDSYGSCDLYTSRRIGSTWSEPENLGKPVNTASWESQPCLAADGRTLYFASTRPWGYGGSDIWRTTLQDDGSWSAPFNLGKEINTSADEMAPFIHPDDHTLYFSSRGHLGMCGADLFISRLDANNNWQKPENIGYPINTNHDEINLIINASGTNAYISSDRANGYGNTDIYRFELPKPARPSMVSYVHGKVYDKNSLQPLAATLELIDMQKNSSIVNSISDPVNGEFVMSLPVDKEYALNVSCKWYLFYSMDFKLKIGQDSTHPVKLDIPMQPLAIGETVVLHNIFFETDKYDLLPDSKAELDKLCTFLNRNSAMKIEIGGHTYSEGSDSHNLTLSNDRAKAVYDFLTANGINAERLTYKGYGETRPIATNDSPEGRASNRRTEFKVISK